MYLLASIWIRKFTLSAATVFGYGCHRKTKKMFLIGCHSHVKQASKCGKH
jgi:hypothetical protein